MLHIPAAIMAAGFNITFGPVSAEYRCVAVLASARSATVEALHQVGDASPDFRPDRCVQDYSGPPFSMRETHSLIQVYPTARGADALAALQAVGGASLASRSVSASSDAKVAASYVRVGGAS
jgi:hypothetical protein